MRVASRAFCGEVAVGVDRALARAEHAHEDAERLGVRDPLAAVADGVAPEQLGDAAQRALGRELADPARLVVDGRRARCRPLASSCLAARSPFSVRTRSRYVLRTEARSSSLPPCRTVPREMGGTLVGIPRSVRRRLRQGGESPRGRPRTAAFAACTWAQEAVALEAADATATREGVDQQAGADREDAASASEPGDDAARARASWTYPRKAGEPRGGSARTAIDAEEHLDARARASVDVRLERDLVERAARPRGPASAPRPRHRCDGDQRAARRRRRSRRARARAVARALRPSGSLRRWRRSPRASASGGGPRRRRTRLRPARITSSHGCVARRHRQHEVPRLAARADLDVLTRAR